MRNFDQVVLRTLALSLVASGFALACSSTNNDTPPGGDDAGTSGTSGTSGGTSGTSGTSGSSGDGGTTGQKCTKNEECPSKVCNIAKGECEAATCKDGTLNGPETDIDCGGACPKCDTAKICKVAADCLSGVCTGGKCAAPTNTDGVKNGNETGVDCGGTANPKCPDGQGCKTRDDCTSDYCKANKCSAITPGDGEQNGNETDVDCGGVGNARCNDALKCLVDADCKSDVCKDLADGMGLRCQAPSPTDGKKNGTETDVDCGGAGNPGCVAGKVCLVGGDCGSGGCNYEFKCAAAKSCTARYGGTTCGLGGAGGRGAEEWEDCCKSIAVNTANGGAMYLDKYPVTAGRMRVFLESVGYDVRTFVQGARAAGMIPNVPERTNLTADPVAHSLLDETWDPFLPTGFNATAAGELSEGSQSCSGAGGGPPCTEGPAQAGIYTAIRNHLGGSIFRNNSQTSTGCYVGGPGTHSFRFPDGMQDGSPPEQPQDVYDTKSLQCVDYLVAQAFCIWDGGRLETFTEWQAAWGAATLPWGAGPTPVTVGSASYWGCRFPWAYDADQSQCGLARWSSYMQADDGRSNEYANYMYSYEYPKKSGAQVDYIVHLTPPGRLKGRGPLGHSDIVGTGFELTSSVNWAAYAEANRDSGPFQGRHRWAGNGSWEVHAYNRNYSGATMLLNKYGKLGMRCARPTSYE